jgi:uncharacterized protein (DUF433 family)
MTKERLLDRIVVDPAIMAGKPVIKGTRIPVDLILKLMAEDNPLNSILEDYPHLQREDILAALMYGSEVVAHEDIFPLMAGEEI